MVKRLPRGVISSEVVADAPLWHLVAGPIVKRAGGKRKLLPEILKRLPKTCDTYFEPFAGGAAVFFAYGPNAKRQVISDADSHLIRAYQTIRMNPDLVYAHLANMVSKDDERHYYEVRDLWNVNRRDPQPSLPQIARYLYLNRAGYNGLWRVSKCGALNTPWAHYKRVAIPTRDWFRAAAAALLQAEVNLGDFQPGINRAGAGDVVYVDPPYPGTHDAYTSAGFGHGSHELLADCVYAATRRGAHVVVSIGEHPLSRELYDRPGWTIDEVGISHVMSCKGAGRARKHELLVTCPPTPR